MILQHNNWKQGQFGVSIDGGVDGLSCDFAHESSDVVWDRSLYDDTFVGEGQLQ